MTNDQGNVEIGKSIGPVSVKVEIDPSAPIKNSPVNNQNKVMHRRECAAGLRTEGC